MIAIDNGTPAIWDEAIATKACPQCGATAGVACQPDGYRPHRVRFDHLLEPGTPT